MSKRIRLSDVYIEFYRLMSGIEVSDMDDIPEEAMFVLSSLDYNSLVRPLIHRDLMTEQYSTPGMLGIRYGVSKSYCRRIRLKLGLPPWNGSKRTAKKTNH